MSLYALGLNHQTAPLALRERVVFHVERTYGALATLLKTRIATEAAILSTCNRTEIYYASEAAQPAAGDALTEWLSTYHRVPEAELRPCLYRLQDAHGVRHAFRVASGLDSMVLGEPQILGQMKEAVRAAQSAGTLGTLLHRLFQNSFSVAKQVRSTTRIGAQSVSMAAAAVKLAERIFPSLAEQRILFIGAGEMIDLCATHFMSRAPASVAVANRTIERAEALARRVDGEAIELRNLGARIAEFDIIVSSTASSLPIVGKGLVERALRARRRRPMFFVDLAVPRDVEAEVAELDDVFLYTVDDLGEVVSAGEGARRAEVGEAEAIVDMSVERFMQWWRARESVPLIRALRERAEELRGAELDGAIRRLSQGENPREVLDAFSRALTNKLMHAPTQALSEADTASLASIARAFQLDVTRTGT